MNDTLKGTLIGCTLSVALMMAWDKVSNPHPEEALRETSIKTSEFNDRLAQGKLNDIICAVPMVHARTPKGEGVMANVTSCLNVESKVDDYNADVHVHNAKATSEQDKKQVLNFDNKTPEMSWTQTTMGSIFVSWAPMLLLIGVWAAFMRKGGMGGMNGANSFGKSRAKLLSEDQVKVTFADVAGVDEAKEEVSEMVDFLKDPAKFTTLGGKIPRGALMVGPPGTGKTLLARAIAGEAKVPFFNISGSDFVEMFVGVGASRVRDMFTQAKAKAPCIIFIDEIDAIGRARGRNPQGGNDEREQTLNQLLVEMDGFEGNEGVIVIAATNQPEVLDKALLRPGRFDRQVTVNLPDVRGREQILKVHAKRIPMADGVDLAGTAKGTPGMSGADLANVLNEAALRAARMGKKQVDQTDIGKSVDKVLMGAERKSMIMSPDEKEMTAYHEVGHAITGRLVEAITQYRVSKISIMPRGRALGVTMYHPDENILSRTRDQLRANLVSLLGGRKAEELVYGSANVSTGASNDIERATGMARDYFEKYGFDEGGLGIVKYAKSDDGGFLGQSYRASTASPGTEEKIEQLVKECVAEAYEMAGKMLTADMDQERIAAYFAGVEQAKQDKKAFPGLPRDVLGNSVFHQLTVELYNRETIPRKGYTAEEDGEEVTVVGIDDIIGDIEFDHGFSKREPVFALQAAAAINQNQAPAPAAVA